jgi:hypothetical protein
MSTEAGGSANPMAPRPTHFPARAKRVIFLAMRGAPSQMDLFDYKPRLQTVADQPSEVRGRRYVGSPWRFRQRGQSGVWMSELLPHLARHADELCVIKSMRTDDQTHTGGFVQLHTGSARFVRPSMGSWILYGLGTENANLPGFITIGPSLQFGGAQNYAAFRRAYSDSSSTWCRRSTAPPRNAIRRTASSTASSSLMNSPSACRPSCRASWTLRVNRVLRKRCTGSVQPQLIASAGSVSLPVGSSRKASASSS